MVGVSSGFLLTTFALLTSLLSHIASQERNISEQDNDVRRSPTKGKEYWGFSGKRSVGDISEGLNLSRWPSEEANRIGCLALRNIKPPCQTVNVYKNGSCDLVLSSSFFIQQYHESAMYSTVKGLDPVFPYRGVLGGRASAYRFHLVKRTFISARGHCLRLGAGLVSIETAEEMDFLKQRMEKDTLLRPLGEIRRDRWFGYWTSGSDKDDEGTWIWKATGQRISYSNWCTGAPDDANNQDYLNIMASSFAWDDTKWDEAHYSICEKK